MRSVCTNIPNANDPVDYADNRSIFSHNKDEWTVRMVQSANFIIAPALGAALFSVVPVNYLILLDVLGAVFGVGLLIFVKIPKVSPEILEVPLTILKMQNLGCSN